MYGTGTTLVRKHASVRFVEIERSSSKESNRLDQEADQFAPHPVSHLTFCGVLFYTYSHKCARPRACNTSDLLGGERGTHLRKPIREAVDGINRGHAGAERRSCSGLGHIFLRLLRRYAFRSQGSGPHLDVAVFVAGVIPEDKGREQKDRSRGRNSRRIRGEQREGNGQRQRGQDPRRDRATEKRNRGGRYGDKSSATSLF